MSVNMAYGIGNRSGGGLFSHIKDDYSGNFCVSGHTTGCSVCDMSLTETHVPIDMDWSNEKVLEFLEAIQSEPSLWDIREKNHKNRGVQSDAWRRIKQCLSFPSTIDDLKKKKESLMNYYRNHLNKYKKSLQSGAGTSEIYSTNWFAFELMNSFLKPVYESNSELNSEVPPSDVGVDSEVQETNQLIDSPTPSRTEDLQNSLGQAKKRSSSLQQTNQSTNKQRFVKKNVPPPEIIAAKKQMDEAFDCVKSISSQNQKRDFDEYDHFGLMIAAKIRKMNDPFDRESLMNDIQTVVFQSIMRNRTPSSCGSSSQPLPSNFGQSTPFSVPAQTIFSSYDLEDQQSTQDTFIPAQTTSSQALLSNIGQSIDHSAPAQTIATSDSARRIIISNTGRIQILDNQFLD